MRQRRLGDPERRIDVGLEVSSKSCVLMSDKEACDCWKAALLTKISSPPSSRTVSATSLLQNPSSRISPGSDTPVATLLTNERNDLVRVRLFDGEMVDGNIGPFTREGDGRCPPDTRIAAGNERLSSS